MDHYNRKMYRKIKNREKWAKNNKNRKKNQQKKKRIQGPIQILLYKTDQSICNQISTENENLNIILRLTIELYRSLLTKLIINEP